MIDFKPSNVFLNVIPPLVGTMGQSECEAAAALLVRACQVRGDAWGPVRPTELGAVIGADLDGNVEPWASLNRNPFFRPAFQLLISGGYAEFLDGDEADDGRIAFTDKGLEALRRWVRPVAP